MLDLRLLHYVLRQDTVFPQCGTPPPLVRIVNCRRELWGGKLTISVGGELQWMGFPPREVEIL